MAKDWDLIEADYRANRLSNRQIADKHQVSEGSIRARAKKYAWSKDLGEKVTQRIAAKLQRKAVPADSNSTDEEIIEAAAATGAEIVLSHRKTIADQREIVALVNVRLHEQVSATTIKVLNRDGEEVEVNPSLDYITKSLSAATASLERLVKLERQAFNLDAEEKPVNPLEKLSEAELDAAIESLASQCS